MYISSDVKLYFARFGLVDVQSLSVELDPPPANAALRELQPHEADMVNMVLSDYCNFHLQTVFTVFTQSFSGFPRSLQFPVLVDW